MRSLLIVGLLGLAGCASAPGDHPQPAAASARECFLASSVAGYNVIDDHTVRVTVGANRHYLLATTWNARELNWSEAIAIRSATGQICTGNGLGIEVRGGHPPQTYPITSITREPETPPPSGS